MTQIPDEKFPAYVVKASRELWRIHRVARDPWWFSHDGSGRFDPVGDPRIGASYWALQPLGAFVEVYTELYLATEDIDARQITRLRVPHDLRIADLCSRRALRYGVTATIGADPDYAPGQQLATQLLGAGFAGARWWVRHDPAQTLHGVALFGPVGATTLPGWTTPASEPIDDGLLRRAGRTFGYRAIPRP